MSKTYAVIGLGKFGYHIAKGLVDNNENVILCDNTEDNFKDLRERVNQIYLIDSKDERELREAGICDLDVVVVSIGENIESSILTVMALRELNNKKVIAKAASSIHGAILEKLGVDEVIYPEKQAANRLLSELIKAKVECIDVSANMTVCKAVISGRFVKKTVSEIQGEGSVKMVAIKREESWCLDFGDDFTLQKGDVVLYIGSNSAVSELNKELEDR